MGRYLNRAEASRLPETEWCRLDSDEIYIDDPINFLSAVPDKYGFVFSASFNFYFTDLIFTAIS